MAVQGIAGPRRFSAAMRQAIDAWLKMQEEESEKSTVQ
jgi:hypothetical protein